MLSHPVTCCSEVSSEIETGDLQDNKFTPEAAILKNLVRKITAMNNLILAPIDVEPFNFKKLKIYRPKDT